MRVVGAVEFERHGRLVGEVRDPGRRELHLGRKFVGTDPGGEIGVARMTGQMLIVEPLEELTAGNVGCGREARRPRQVGNRLVGVEGRALEDGKQEGRLPLPRAHLRAAPRVGNGDERRQVAALAAQRVGRPCADAGEAIEREARGHLVFGGAVRVALGRHRVNEAHVVGEFAKPRQKITCHRAALAARLEVPERLDEVALLSLERDQGTAVRGHRGVVPLHEFWLVVEGVDMGERARAEDEQDLVGLGWKVRLPRGIGLRRVDGRADRWLGAEEPLLVK